MKDKILYLGRKLEKKGQKSLEIRYGDAPPYLFRSHGLQVIPREAEELDTNGSCTLIITPLAGAISGLIIQLLRILGEGKNGMARANRAIQSYKQVLSEKRDRTPGSWEQDAMKTLIATSLELADKVPRQLPADTDLQPEQIDSSTGVENHAARMWLQAKLTLRQASANMEQAQEAGLNPWISPSKASGNTPSWRQVAGINGVVIDGYWIPLVFSGAKVEASIITKVLRSLKRLKLKPEIALIAFADQKSRKKRRSR